MNTNHTSPSILFEQHADGVAVITFNRPAAHNALSFEAMDAFAAAIERLHAWSALRAVVLTGAGERAFCSGADLVELANYPTAEDAARMVGIMGDALLRLEQLPVPVIAGINGYALGGGSEIAVACDLRLADDKTRMGFVQIRLAVTPGWGAGQRLLRLVGYSRALDLLVSGRILHGDELHSLGLVNRIVETGTAARHALTLAQRIATESPAAIRAMKQLLQAGLTTPYAEAQQFERELFPPLWGSEAHAHAVEGALLRLKEKQPQSEHEAR
jgi:enoyl-CoA hydratase